ncbi:hypothetical protein [Streptomyces sp. 039-1]
MTLLSETLPQYFGDLAAALTLAVAAWLVRKYHDRDEDPDQDDSA